VVEQWFVKPLVEGSIPSLLVMGLDMTLRAKCKRLDVGVMRLGFPFEVLNVELEICSWRKEYALQRWFADRVKVDHCEDVPVDRMVLHELVVHCKQVLESARVDERQIEIDEVITYDRTYETVLYALDRLPHDTIFTYCEC
jgi:hypothetical protein